MGGRWKPPGKDGPAVSVQGICKRYGKINALEEVDLLVKRGEMFGLIGPNGAGKSTLMKSLIGTVKPECGRISVLGMDPSSEGLRIKSYTGYVPESETPPSFLKLDEFPSAQQGDTWSLDVFAVDLDDE